MSAEEVPAKPAPMQSRTVIGSRARKQQPFERPGLSQQIPIKVIDRAAKETVEPPLGARSFDELTKLLIDSTDHAACVEQIAIDVAGRGWDLVANVEGEEINKEEEAIAREFLEAPNDEDTLADVLKKAMVDYGTLGNAWIELVREGNKPDGLPTQLIHAPGIAMRIRNNLEGYVMLSLETNRWAFFRKLFSDPAAPTSLDKKNNLLNEMIYWRRYHPGSVYYGVPKIVPAMRAIKGSLYASERNIRFFLNRAMPEWAVIVEGQTDTINTPELNALLDDLEEHWTNILKGDDYRTWIGYLPVGITIRFEKISIEVDDATHLQYMTWNRDEILRANGMMPNRIGIIESGNIGAGTGESQIEIYKASAVEPPQDMIERTINMILHAERPMGFGLKSVRWELKDIDSADELRDAQIAATIASTGWASFNEGKEILTRLTKMDFAEIEENWADLPPQIVVPQLSGFIETPVAPEMETPGLRPGVSAFGTPVASLGPGTGLPISTTPGLSGRPRPPISVDRAMLALREGFGRARRRDGA